MPPPFPPSPPPPPPSYPALSALAQPLPNPVFPPNRRRHRVSSARPVRYVAPVHHLFRVPGVVPGQGPHLAPAGADRGRGPGRGSAGAGPGLQRGAGGHPGGALGLGLGRLLAEAAEVHILKGDGNGMRIGGTTTAVRVRGVALVGTAAKWTTRG